MSTKPIYQYTWKSGWKFDKQQVKDVHATNEAVQTDIKNGMRTAMLEQFSKKFAELGHWYVVDSINVNITSFELLRPGYSPYFPCSASAEGTTTVIFRSDATLEQEFSPQGWEEVLLAICEAILAAIILHPVLFFALLLIVALTVFSLAGGFKGVLFGAGGGGTLGDIGTIIAIGIIGIGGLLVLSSVLGKEKGKGKRRR
jgi:hypothetical protein